MGSQEGENYFTIRKLSIYIVKESETRPNPQNTPGGNQDKKAQPTILCRDLKLMSRHGILLMAHYQSRPLPFKLQPVCLSTALISGRDIEVMSRHLLFSVPSVLMSRLQNDVATSLSSYSSSVCVATSFLGCDYLDVCMMTSCCDFDS